MAKSASYKMTVEDLKKLQRLSYRMRKISDNETGNISFHAKTISTAIETFIDYLMTETFHDYKKAITDGIEKTEFNEVETSARNTTNV